MPERRIVLASFAAAVLGLAGCGGGRPPASDGPGGTPTGKEGLTNLYHLLKGFEDQKKAPPARIADVEKVEPLYPGAYIALVQKTIVYSWGAPLNAANGGTVLAHEKDVPTAGGWVLMQDGTVKKMTADEFKAAKMATK